MPNLTRWTIPGAGPPNEGTPSVFDESFSGTANFISRDLEGQVWFTETAVNVIGRLNPITNVFEQFTKPGISTPHAIASAGIGPTLQTLFTEFAGNQVSVVTRAAAAPMTTPVVPDMETIVPEIHRGTYFDFTPPMVTTVIPPVVTLSTSTDPSGIDRFPVPPFTTGPTGTESFFSRVGLVATSSKAT